VLAPQPHKVPNNPYQPDNLRIAGAWNPLRSLLGSSQAIFPVCLADGVPEDRRDCDTPLWRLVRVLPPLELLEWFTALQIEQPGIVQALNPGDDHLGGGEAASYIYIYIYI
jgi:hypothetical protein